MQIYAKTDLYSNKYGISLPIVGTTTNGHKWALVYLDSVEDGAFEDPRRFKTTNALKPCSQRQTFSRCL